MPTQTRFSNLSADLVRRLNDMEFRCCYAAAVVRATRARYRLAKWVVAAAACVPFITYIRTLSGPLEQAIAAFVPLVAIALPLWNADKVIEAASKLHGKYSALLPPLRDLWRAVRDIGEDLSEQDHLADKIQGLLTQTDDQSAALSQDLLELPDSPSLKKECARSVPRYEITRIDPPDDEHLVMHAPAPGPD